MKAIFEGIRVLDLGRFVAVPFAGTMFGQLEDLMAFMINHRLIAKIMDTTIPIDRQ